MGYSELIVKNVLFILNLLFAISGLVLLGFGVAGQLNFEEVLSITDGYVKAAPIVLIVGGGIVFSIAFFGCCGAVTESNCMLSIYSILLLLLIIIKVTLAVLIFVKLDYILDLVSVTYTHVFKTSPKSFEIIEKFFACCGPNGTESYIVNGLSPSATCCGQEVGTCTFVKPLFTADNCISATQTFLKTYSLTIGLGIIAVAAIELVAVVLSLWLANYVRRNNNNKAYF